MEWVKTKDRMPILITDNFGTYESVDIIAYDGIRVFPAVCAAGRQPWFWCEIKRDGVRVEWDSITHWMPLPEPPKSDD